MHHKIRRAATVAAATGGALALSTGTAAAHYCINESVEGKAGEAYALFSSDFELIELGGGLRLQGDIVVGSGLADIYIDDGDGKLDADDWLLADNLFVHTGLPLSALTAAGCEQGVGTAFAEEFGLDGCP